MAFNRPTLSELRTRIAADVARHADGDPHQRGSLEFAMANALTGAAHGLHGSLAYLADQLFDDSADDTNLERRAAEYKLYRIGAKPAKGPIGVTGNVGVQIPAGHQWFRGDVYYTVDTDQVIVAGVATLEVSAVQAGTIGNQSAGAKLDIVVPIDGLDSVATVAELGITAGADEENLDRLRQRLQERKAKPPRGGSSDDWVAWCKAGHQDVTRVWVRRNQDSSGATVYGVVSCYLVTDELVSPIPGSAILDTVYAYCDQVDIRPAGMKAFYILAPTAKPLDLVFTGLQPNTPAVRDAITAELKDLLAREAEPGVTILLSHIREAISLATGEHDFAITLNADFACATNEFAVLGEITWPAP